MTNPRTPHRGNIAEWPEHLQPKIRAMTDDEADAYYKDSNAIFSQIDKVEKRMKRHTDPKLQTKLDALWDSWYAVRTAHKVVTYRNDMKRLAD